MTPDPQNPHAHFFARLAASAPAVLDLLTRRLWLEFDPRARIELREVSDSLPTAWVSLGPLPTDRLAGAQRHLDRLLALYCAADSAASFTAAYLDPYKAVRAALTNSPDAAYAGDGVWAEAFMRCPSGATIYAILPGADGAWSSNACLTFLSRLSAAPLEGAAASHVVSDASGCR